MMLWMGFAWADPVPPLTHPIDVLPETCPNTLNVHSRGVLTVAILGMKDRPFELADMDTIRLVGVAPIRHAFEDVAAPYTPFVGKSGCDDCASAGVDGMVDLVLKFDRQAVISALGKVHEGECRVVRLTLKTTYGRPVVGEDVLRIRKGSHLELKIDLGGIKAKGVLRVTTKDGKKDGAHASPSLQPAPGTLATGWAKLKRG